MRIANRWITPLENETALAFAAVVFLQQGKSFAEWFPGIVEECRHCFTRVTPSVG